MTGTLLGALLHTAKLAIVGYLTGYIVASIFYLVWPEGPDGDG